MVLRPKLLSSELSETQARKLLHTIRFPGFEDEHNASTATLPPATLSTLSRLHIHFILSFPFEALSLNYEPEGTMNNSISHIFSRFVEKRSGGGYCMQVNVLYREMLSFLRFRFIGVIGRVYSPVTADWTGLTHTGTLVYLPSHLVEDKRKKVYYLSDVGFGSSPHRPILLRNGWEEYGRGTDKFRVVKETIQPRSTLEESDSDSESMEKVDDQVAEVATTQGCWKLQVLKKGKSEWEDCYSFTTFECFRPDYDASNRSTSFPGAAPFGTMILVVRYLLTEGDSEELVKRDGLNKELYPYHPSLVEQRMIVDTKYIVKRGDEQVVFKEIGSEEERVELLKSEFGLLGHVETAEAVKEIQGKPSRMKAKEGVDGNKE